MPLLSKWDAMFGDRSQELVLIGVHLQKDRMRAALNEALLTEEEMRDVEAWRGLEDPFFGGKCAELFWDLPKREEDSEAHSQQVRKGQ